MAVESNFDSPTYGRRGRLLGAQEGYQERREPFIWAIAAWAFWNRNNKMMGERHLFNQELSYQEKLMLFGKNEESFHLD